ncbi:magnesium/cobalt transporter CorA [Comamonas sp. NLF-1-9]|uniref:magnesium/cobalt transporter CorA n=1 Tax=Comamonas sp. NLF-1-9 TaxID=2853163 RepID=UPI001C465D2C|nr:magnesium/cobalt transporter CorA [Comamonas sp. NLF-1-9]QXL83900.1 magnesium/cobalt transporter CorA [Comamonas sp. NLF-1-9]
MGRLRPGATPGSLTDAEAPTHGGASLSLLRYDAHGVVQEQSAVQPNAQLLPQPGETGVSWLHLQGQPTAAQMQALGQVFGLHPLALEDVLQEEALPKCEVFDGQLFVVLQLVQREPDGGCSVEPVTFFLGPGYVISIGDGPSALFEPVRQRIRGGGHICSFGADHLLYALIDVVVDSAFGLLQQLGERLDALEDEILEYPGRQARRQIHYARRELVLMRRAWWPQREVIATLTRNDERLLSQATRVYLRDCHDHAVIVVDLVESCREMASSLLDVYLSAVNQRMNDIMKVLTIIATIFMPLSFITGVYGMNFDTDSPWNMPELHWRFGYWYALGLMATVVFVMLAYFKHRRWW